MLQLAVCDDEAVCLRQTVDILRAALGDTPHQLKTFENAPAMLAMLAEDGYRPDIAVLDICMGDMDGITLAKQINRLAPACRVIFLSSYAGYLMDAYEAEHIYYVLKSDEAARLPVALRKALGALSTEKTLTLRRGGSYQRVGLDTVLYLERSLHKMFVHTTDGDLETTQSPQALLAGDVAAEFIRCHQSFWVNSRVIVGMEHETFCLSDGTRVPLVSQGCARGVFPAVGRAHRAAGCTGGRSRWRITVSGRTFCSTPASWRRGVCFCGACSTGRDFRGGARCCSRS